LDEGVNRGHPKHELVEIRRLKPFSLELTEEPCLATAPLDQCLSRALGIELEAKKEAAILDVAELDFESDAGIEESRAIGVSGFDRFRIDETNQGSELDVAEEDRCAADDREDFLYGLPPGLGCSAEMTDSHEDERGDGGTHPVILVHCVRNTYHL
jgi:hypothetical protein